MVRSIRVHPRPFAAKPAFIPRCGRWLWPFTCRTSISFAICSRRAPGGINVPGPAFQALHRAAGRHTYEAFLSAPVLAHNRVTGVINVQHREPHFYSGGEMELLTTVGEQIGCLVTMALVDPAALTADHVLDLVMAPARRMS
ncbi:MAG TPA: GAF domain-containing protein [Bryobacteraceae bacterium]|nr:GAF domain-containing protein [Bryobacteraceae bacterium]